jgi:hypothetical protein
MADGRGGSDTELRAVFDSRIDALRKMAQELGIPPAEAARWIDQALHASLLLKGNLDVDRWLAASMRQAAKRRTERAK